MRVTIIGSGYVGLTTGVALAYIGHHVTLLDKNKEVIKKLKNGVSPIHEKGIEELLVDSLIRLQFIDDWDMLDADTDIIIVAVGTPSKKNGDADLSFVEDVAISIGERISKDNIPLIVTKSTVPVGTQKRLKMVIQSILHKRGISKSVKVASNPEFLREGQALYDTFFPDRIVIGVEEEDSRFLLQKLYLPILEQSFTPPPSLQRPERIPLPALIVTNPTSAEMIKYAANAYLAMKISFINEFANLADKVGADINEIAQGIGLDSRIGRAYLNAGIGWGGSCFGKDTKAISFFARQYDAQLHLVESSIEVNYRQRMEIVKKLQNTLHVIRGMKIGILGLSFKPNTDDLRDAPSIDIIEKLLELGAHVIVHDPIAIPNFKKQYPYINIEYAGTIDEVFIEADAVLLVTEWDEYKHLPYYKLAKIMKNKLLIDGRNALDKNIIEEAGIKYLGIGR
ncbi:UDP-glucose dehydrogenase family protein [Tepidibacillus sp. LV47]|uniref:UDP-glucose dehydrogenase family protein n=1 Tax=Tepidibacillus sp. LV47 TaxID=3398228 RepID=UPI003AAEF066